MTEQSTEAITANWEHFPDPAYFDTWCVRQKDGSQAFGHGFHVINEIEARQLAIRLANIEARNAKCLLDTLRSTAERLNEAKSLHAAAAAREKILRDKLAALAGALDAFGNDAE